MKDIIVDPMQMAEALEKGATATILIACVVRYAHILQYTVCIVIKSVGDVETAGGGGREREGKGGAGVGQKGR